MFLSPEVIIVLGVDLIIFVFFLISFFISVLIVKYFDFKKENEFQYKLEKMTYLVSVVVKFSIFFKLILFFYLIYVLDKLSVVIPGAMCAAGVVNSNKYGVWMLILAILNIFLFGFWLLVNNEDFKRKDYLFTKRKFAFFIVIFAFFFIELLLKFFYFANLDVSKIVSCCGVLFNETANSGFGVFLEIPRQLIGYIFYFIFFGIVVSGYFKTSYLFSFLNFLYLFFSILAIIVFFSPYIYQLPTHRCPFCFLQKEYYYIGYLIYTVLFLGIFFGMAEGFLKWFLGINKNFFKISILFDTILLMSLSFYVWGYYLINKVWLY